MAQMQSTFEIEGARTKEFLERILSAFVLGEFDALAADFDTPTVIYSAAGLFILNSPDEFSKIFVGYKKLLDDREIVQSSYRIIDQGPVVNRRLKVTAEFTKSHFQGNKTVKSTVKFFLRVLGCGNLRIEMLEYISLPVAVEDIAQALH